MLNLSFSNSVRDYRCVRQQEFIMSYPLIHLLGRYLAKSVKYFYTKMQIG